MTDSPTYISDCETFDYPTTDIDIANLPPLPPSPPLLPTPISRRRTPSPPAPTIYLTGYRCHISDLEYDYARERTGDAQPYWFEEAYGAADFNEGVRRRVTRDMVPLEDEVAIPDLDDAGNEMDRVVARDQRERAREREVMREETGWWPGGDTDANRMATEEEGLRQRVMTRGEHWKQLEAERERLRKEEKKLKAKEKEEKQRGKDERRAPRVPIRDRALSLLDFTKPTKQKKKPESEVAEPQPEAAVESKPRAIELQPEAAQDIEEYHALTTEDAAQLPSPPTRDPPPTPLTVRNPDPTEAVSQPPSTPTHGQSPPRGRAPMRPRATTPPSLKSLTTTDTDIDAQTGSTALTSQLSSSSVTRVQVEVPVVSMPVPENSGLVQGVGTLERMIPENSGLLQDFGTLERARSLKASSGRFLGCCVGRRK